MFSGRDLVERLECLAVNAEVARVHLLVTEKFAKDFGWPPGSKSGSALR
jgi:hypothetical protein